MLTPIQIKYKYGDRAYPINIILGSLARSNYLLPEGLQTKAYHELFWYISNNYIHSPFGAKSHIRSQLRVDYATPPPS